MSETAQEPTQETVPDPAAPTVTQDPMVFMDAVCNKVIESSHACGAQVFITYFMSHDPENTSRMASNFSTAARVSLISGIMGSLGLDEKAAKDVSSILMNALARKIVPGTPPLVVVKN